MLIVIAGPSGVGKGTVIKALLKQMPHLQLAVSCTTRQPRKGEQQGKDYVFVSEDEFEQTDFLEWAVVHGYKYGTPNKDYQGDVVFEVDVQGAQAIKANRPDCLSIFLIPPSTDELEKRLLKRNTEKPADIKRRMETAKQELKKRFNYDYIIVNKVLIDTVEKVKEVMKLEQTKRKDLSL